MSLSFVPTSTSFLLFHYVLNCRHLLLVYLCRFIFQLFPTDLLLTNCWCAFVSLDPNMFSSLTPLSSFQHLSYVLYQPEYCFLFFQCTFAVLRHFFVPFCISFYVDIIIVLPRTTRYTDHLILVFFILQCCHYDIPPVNTFITDITPYNLLLFAFSYSLHLHAKFYTG